MMTPDGQATSRNRDRTMNAPQPDPPDDRQRQSDALNTSRGDRDRALDAMRVLEDAAGQPGPGRDQAWRATVTAALRTLQEAIAEQQASYDAPGSLMAQIAQDDPRLRTLIRQLQHRWSDLAATSRTLAETLQGNGGNDAWTVADTREQLRWLMTALHHHRAREADLIFSALGIDIAASSDG